MKLRSGVMPSRVGLAVLKDNERPFLPNLSTQTVSVLHAHLTDGGLQFGKGGLWTRSDFYSGFHV